MPLESPLLDTCGSTAIILRPKRTWPYYLALHLSHTYHGWTIAYLLIVYHLCRPEGKLLESKDLVSLHVITSDNEQPFSRYVWDE